VARAANGRFDRVDTNIKNADGDLLESAIPSVSIVKDGGFYAEEYFDDPSVTADLKALVAQKLGPGRLAGFVIEGLTPYGTIGAAGRAATGDLLRATGCTQRTAPASHPQRSFLLCTRRKANAVMPSMLSTVRHDFAVSYLFAAAHTE
jgi:hypothetical protein